MWYSITLYWPILKLCSDLLGKGNFGWQMRDWWTGLCTICSSLFQVQDLAGRCWSTGWIFFQWKSEQDVCCMQKSLSIMEFLLSKESDRMLCLLFWHVSNSIIRTYHDNAVITLTRHHHYIIAAIFAAFQNKDGINRAQTAQRPCSLVKWLKLKRSLVKKPGLVCIVVIKKAGWICIQTSVLW